PRWYPADEASWPRFSSSTARALPAPRVQRATPNKELVFALVPTTQECGGRRGCRRYTSRGSARAGRSRNGARCRRRRGRDNRSHQAEATTRQPRRARAQEDVEHELGGRLRRRRVLGRAAEARGAEDEDRGAEDAGNRAEDALAAAGAPPQPGVPPAGGAAPRSAAEGEARADRLGRRRRAARRRARGRQGRRGLPRAAGAALDRREHLS